MAVPTDEQLLAAVVTTYPAWRIIIWKGTWWATKEVPPTSAQQAAGVLHQFARPSGLELVVALAAQDAILARDRAFPGTPPAGDG